MRIREARVLLGEDNVWKTDTLVFGFNPGSDSVFDSGPDLDSDAESDPDSGSDLDSDD